MSVPRRVAILGAGEIGSGWAALFAAFGAQVRLVDPDPDAGRRAQAALDTARALGIGMADPWAIRTSTDLAGAVADADWIQESLPESEALKRGALEAIDSLVAPNAIVASSTSTLMATRLAEGRPYADRMLVVHPLHPVYAVPVVEVCAGERTAPSTVERAMDVLRSVDREPILLRGEVPGLVANRLVAALLREAFDLVSRGIIDAQSLDCLVARGIALGWTAAGPMRTEAIGAGHDGFTGFLDRLAEPLAGLWSSLASWQRLDAAQRAALVASMSRDGDAMKELVDESEWAATLARIERAADGP